MLKKLLLLATLAVSLNSCAICDWFGGGGTVILGESDLIYLIEDGKLNYYDKDGKLAKTATLEELEGWFVIQGGKLKKLIDAWNKQENPLPADPDQ